MNLRDRRQPESGRYGMSGSLQPDGSRRMQNWNDTTGKYRMLLEEQSDTIRTQKNIISEQEKIICRQDSRHQGAGQEDSGAEKRSGAGQNRYGRGGKQSERTARGRAIRERFADFAGIEPGTGIEEESRKSRAGFEPDGTGLFLTDIHVQVRDSESEIGVAVAEGEMLDEVDL